MVTASGKEEVFIAGNGRKENKKDMDFISGQMEMNTTENGKIAREQEQESRNWWQQAQSKDAISKTTRS